MSGPISPGMTTTIRRLFDSVHLRHTYTRTPRDAPARDIWARAPRTNNIAGPTTGVACRYVARTSLVVGPGGFVRAETPPLAGGTFTFRQTLVVAHDDPIAVGDQVSNVVDAGGTVLLVGPVSVQAVMPHAGLGATSLKSLILRGPVGELNG